MRLAQAGLLFCIVLALLSCGRSKEVQFYLLNPLPPQKLEVKRYRHLRIGIEEISLPATVDKPQLMIHCTPSLLKLSENHQWAETLNKNITRLVKTNLRELLPGAVVESSPWNSRFRPNYYLQLDISQWEIATNGENALRAEYFIYKNDKMLKKAKVYFHSKIPVVTIESLIISMNDHMSCLTQHIARSFKNR